MKRRLKLAFLSIGLLFLCRALPTQAQTIGSVYDDTDSSIIYSRTVVPSTGWTAGTGAPDYNGTQHYSNGCVNPPQTATSVQGPMAAINFIGTGTTLIGEKGANFGIGAYALDGGALSPVDAYSSTHLYQQPQSLSLGSQINLMF